MWAVEESKVLPQLPDRDNLKAEGFILALSFRGFQSYLGTGYERSWWWELIVGGFPSLAHQEAHRSVLWDVRTQGVC